MRITFVGFAFIWQVQFKNLLKTTWEPLTENMFLNKESQIWKIHFYHQISENPDKNIGVLKTAWSKTRKIRKSRKTRKFFSEIFISEFSILAVGQIENLEIRKLGIIFPRFLRFPKFPSFRFATFSFSFLIFFLFL